MEQYSAKINEVAKNLKKLSYNSDLHKLLSNIYDMNMTYEKLLVKARQTHKYDEAIEYSTELEKTIDYLEKMIIIAHLCA
jgi:hypothetical protein